jgi:hypothetical protein
MVSGPLRLLKFHFAIRSRQSCTLALTEKVLHVTATIEYDLLHVT